MADSESTPLRPGSWREERATETPSEPPPEQSPEQPGAEQPGEGKSGGGVWWKVIIAILLIGVIGAIGACVACGDDSDPVGFHDRSEEEQLALCLFLGTKINELQDAGVTSSDEVSLALAEEFGGTALGVELMVAQCANLLRGLESEESN